jgi:putative redox protein
MLGATCGSLGATFARVARETGVMYDGINFEASFAADPRGLAGQPGVRPYFETVMIQARIRAARPDSRLADVARATERRCPLRNLMTDAGVRVELRWSAAGPEAPPPGVPEDPGVLRQPGG